jgi:hypothetical protein
VLSVVHCRQRPGAAAAGPALVLQPPPVRPGPLQPPPHNRDSEISACKSAMGALMPHCLPCVQNACARPALHRRQTPQLSAPAWELPRGFAWLRVAAERRAARGGGSTAALAEYATSGTGALERRSCALTQGPSPAAGSGTNGHSSGRLQGPQRSAELSVQRRPSTPLPDTPPVQVRPRCNSCLSDALPRACVRVRRGASTAPQRDGLVGCTAVAASLRAGSAPHRPSAAGGRCPLAPQRRQWVLWASGRARTRADVRWRMCAMSRAATRMRALQACSRPWPAQRGARTAEHAREPVLGAQARRLSRGDGAAAPPKPPRDALDRV